MGFDLQAIQSDLKAAKLHGWLFYDFRGRDPIAHRILNLPPGMRTRLIGYGFTNGNSVSSPTGYDPVYNWTTNGYPQDFPSPEPTINCGMYWLRASR